MSIETSIPELKLNTKESPRSPKGFLYNHFRSIFLYFYDASFCFNEGPLASCSFLIISKASFNSLAWSINATFRLSFSSCNQSFSLCNSSFLPSRVSVEYSFTPTVSSRSSETTLSSPSDISIPASFDILAMSPFSVICLIYWSFSSSFFSEYRYKGPSSEVASFEHR